MAAQALSAKAKRYHIKNRYITYIFYKNLVNQFLMVTGGKSASSGSDKIGRDTTEVYNGIDWKIVSGKLPKAVITPGLINIGKKILVMGQYKIVPWSPLLFYPKYIGWSARGRI